MGNRGSKTGGGGGQNKGRMPTHDGGATATADAAAATLPLPAASASMSELKPSEIAMLTGSALLRIRQHNFEVYRSMASRDSGSGNSGSGSSGNSGSGNAEAPMHTYSEYVMIEKKTPMTDKKEASAAKRVTYERDPLYNVWLLKTNDTASVNDIGRKIPTDDEGYFVRLMDEGGRKTEKLRNVAIHRSQLRPVSEMMRSSTIDDDDDAISEDFVEDRMGDRMEDLKAYVCEACTSVSRELDAANLTAVSVSHDETPRRRVAPAAVLMMAQAWESELARVSKDDGDGVRFYILRPNDSANNVLKIVLQTDYDDIDGENHFTLVHENHPVYIRLFMLEANGFAPTAEGLNVINWDNEPVYHDVMETVTEIYTTRYAAQSDRNTMYEPKDLAFLRSYLTTLASNGFVMEVAPDIREMV